MSRIAYVNGRYLPQSEASVNIEDRGYQFADGVYEVVHLYQNRLIDTDRHMSRLERSLREIRLSPPMGRVAMLHVLREVAARNRVREGILYMQITRGVARRDHAFPTNPVPPAMVVTVRRTASYPTNVEKWAASAITHPDERWARCDIKSVGLLANVLAKQAARDAGAYEAILIDKLGDVTEGSSTSVWIVDAQGVLRTRFLDNHILPGCTRDALTALLVTETIAYSETSFTEAELRGAREIFVSSASSFVKPITRLDGAPVGDGAVGPVARRLFDLFARHVKGDLSNVTV
jgi:D-alanine transaminase